MHPSFLFIDEYVALRTVFPPKAAKDSDYCVNTFDSVIKRIVTMGASAGCYVIISIAEASVQEGGLPAMLRSAKVLSVASCGPLQDFTTKQVTGTKVTTVIIEDNTPYKPKADGSTISNLYEKIVVKVPGKMGLTIPVGSVVELINPVGTVYGEYRNQLSITADDIKVIGAAKG